MKTTADASPLRPGSVMFLLACASLGLNVFLVARFFQPHPGHRSQPAPANAGPGKDQRLGLPVTATADATTVARGVTAAPPFLWNQIESADYRQYVANLRAVGCPEQIIRDIVVADLNQAFAARFAAIWIPEVREYWQKSQGGQPNLQQEKQLLALDREKAELLRELLRVHLDARVSALDTEN